jgi:hypothetical protein
MCHFHHYNCILVEVPSTTNVNYRFNILLLPHIPLQEIFHFCHIWVYYVFGINNLKIMSHIFIIIIKGKLSDNTTKYIPCYWIVLLSTYLKLSRNCIVFPKVVLAKKEITLSSDSLHQPLMRHPTESFNNTYYLFKHTIKSHNCS